MEHYRVRLYQECGPVLEAIFHSQEEVINWVNFRPAEKFPYIEIDEPNDCGVWEMMQNWIRH